MSTHPMHDHREAIAEVLYRHAFLSSDEQEVDDKWTWGFNCECGEFIPDAEANAHLTDALLGSDVLAQIRAEARAEALMEAADVLSYQSWVDGRPEYRAGPENCANWLRARAGGSA